VPYASKTQARIPESEFLGIATPIVTVVVEAGSNRQSKGSTRVLRRYQVQLGYGRLRRV